MMDAFNTAEEGNTKFGYGIQSYKDGSSLFGTWINNEEISEG